MVSYSILFNSKNGINQMSGADVLITETNSVSFPMVYWDRMLPEGKYKLTWSYTGSGNNINQNNVAKVRMIGFRNDNTYNTTQNNGTESNTLDLGTLKCKYVMDSDNNAATNVSCLTANLDDNEPIILERRPDNAPLTIQILNQNNNLWYDSIGTILSGTIQGGTINYNIINMPARARVNIGTVVWWNSANSRLNKIIDYNTGFGINSATDYNYKTSGSFATGGIGLRIEPSNPPGHFILQLNFEKI